MIKTAAEQAQGGGGGGAGGGGDGGMGGLAEMIRKATEEAQRGIPPADGRG